MIEGLSNDDIIKLYVPFTDSLTIYAMIMVIESTNKQTPGTLIRTVGQDWKGRFIFVLFENKEDKEMMITDDIIPYLLHVYSVKMGTLFDPDPKPLKNIIVFN